MNVTVVGCGYVGLVTGVCFASLGHKVTGVEINEERAARIRDGIAPFHEPGLAERLGSSLAEGTFKVSSQLDDAVDADVIFLCVQTPMAADGKLDTTFLADAAEELSQVLSGTGRRHALVVRSTVTPGTTEHLIAPIVRAHNPMVAVASNPEFLREGSAVSDFMEPDRVVIGLNDPWAAGVVADLYEPLDALVVHTTPSAAELAKCTSNAFLATLISFSNQIARIAEAIPGVEVEEVLSILHKDRRLSPVVDDQTISPGILSYLKPGAGFGGACLPKDLSALTHYAAAVGERAEMLEAVMEINETQPSRLVSIIEDELGQLAGQRIAVLGVAFKAETDDLRESPGLKVIDLLLEKGAGVSAYDPLVARDAVEGLTEKGVGFAPNLGDAVRDADACLIATRADEFLELPASLDAVGNERAIIVDGRRLLDPETLSGPRKYIAVGRSRKEPTESAGASSL